VPTDETKTSKTQITDTNKLDPCVEKSTAIKWQPPKLYKYDTKENTLNGANITNDGPGYS